GAHVPGKPREAYVFIGGAPLYRAISGDVVKSGYGGFSIGGAPARGIPPMVQVDPAVAAVLGGQMTQDTKPLEEYTLEEIRQAVEGFSMMQAPPPADVRVVETTYPGPAGERPVRIYIPEASGPLPVVVYLHGGGFMAGSIDMCARPSAALA